MSLLSDIEGQRRENLCSALLGHILMRSPEAREAVISLLSDKAPQGPIYVHNNFAVFREETSRSDEAGASQTTEVTSGSGRLDIVVETDDTIVGIESKFNAVFQDRQPRGYLEHLRSRAKQLGELRRQSFGCVLVVLAPSARETEVAAKIRAQKIGDACVFVSWQELLKRLSSIPSASPIDAFLIREFASYATEQITPIADLARLLPHVLKRWSPRGSGSQKQLMNHFVWSLLDSRLTQDYRFGGGRDHYGYYLYAGQERELQAWLGFVDRMCSLPEEERQEGSAFVVSVYSKSGTLAAPSGKPFRPIDFPGWGAEGWRSVELIFDPTHPEWQRHERWTEAFEPINAIFGR